MGNRMVDLKEDDHGPWDHRHQLPTQTIYTFAATSRILGVHVTTLHKRARDGKLKTVNTPVGRRIHRDEIRRQYGGIRRKRNRRAVQVRRRETTNRRPRLGALALGMSEETLPRLRGNEGHVGKT